MKKAQLICLRHGQKVLQQNENYHKMKKAQLICIRHGQKVLRQIEQSEAEKLGIDREEANADLTELGHKQARVTADFLLQELSGAKVVTIYTSELKRTLSTAAPLIEGLQRSGCQVLVKTLPELNEKNERVLGTRVFEELEDFVKRVRQFVNDHLSKEWTCPIVLSGHSVFISILISLLPNPQNKFPQPEHRIPHCSITRFSRIEGQCILDCSPSVDHLPTQLQTRVD